MLWILLNTSGHENRIGPAARGQLGADSNAAAHPRRFTMIVLGVVLLIVGFIAKVPILWTLGIIAIVVGAVLALFGGTGRTIGGRRHYY
jgi:uncharacterized membrane protein HdeD (DUF308 family)